ncbi:MAG: hypothetical protein IPM52_04910 [Bacteroidetes bacterium]|nr:hypothetical protein [Bacteroidota bacterium]
MKRILASSLVVISLAVGAQNETDALRFSQQFYQGTARSMSMGGAFGAIGADFSTLSTNPAGMGLFRSSELSLSPILTNVNSQSTYNGMFGEDTRTGLNFSNMGVVSVNKVSGTQAPWKYFQIGFGMNRTNNFSQRMFVQGDNNDHSRVDVFLDKVAGTSPSQIERNFPYDIYPAWYVYLIDTVRNSQGQLIYTSPVPQGGIRQFESTNTWGSTNEWLISASGNLNDQVFVGATLGMPYTRYFHETTFTEKDVNNSISDFDEWNFRQKIESRGWGLNLKVGVIVWPVEWLRVGAAVHTPTWYSQLNDQWSTSIDAKLGPDYNQQSSPTGEFTYQLQTPMRANGSLAFIIGQQGIISAEYEHVDYTKMRLRSSDYNFLAENDAIRSSFAASNIFRFGTEWRLSNFSFRGGYATYGSPFKDGINDASLRNLSFGLGYSEKSFGIDLAFVNGQREQDYYMYTSANWNPNPAAQKITSNQFVLSTRFRF